MANLTKKYDAKGVLSNSDLTLTEKVKEDIFVHSLEDALQMFEGEEVSISITRKQEIKPQDVEGA